MSEHVGVDDCLSDALSGLRPAAGYPHLLLDALGLIADRDVMAPHAIPEVDCAAIAGYAVRAIDTQGASPATPVALGVVGEVKLGQASNVAVVAGASAGIAAGAPLPAGADAVVAPDDTDGGSREVLVTAPSYTGQFVRRSGDDVAKGDVVLARGDVVDAREVGLLAGMGIEQVSVIPRPRVVVISAGAELVGPGRSAHAGEAHDANSYLLAAAARSADCISYRVAVPSNDPAKLAEVLDDQLVRADLVVMTGGRADVARAALNHESGVQFRDIAMLPGPSIGYGFMGPERTPIFVLPPDPVAAYIAFEVFVAPALRRLSSRSPQSRPLFRARLETDVRSVVGKRHFVCAEYNSDAQGARVKPVGGVGHLPGGLARANALIVLREDVAVAKANEPVPIILLDREY